VTGSHRRGFSRLLPRSLFGRVAVILFFGLAAAHVLTVALVLGERGQASWTMMLSYVAKDVATAVAILDSVPAADRPAWLSRIERANYSYVLGAPPDGAPSLSPATQQLVAAVATAVGPGYVVSATAPANGTDPAALRLHLRLTDGTPLTIKLSTPSLAISPWVPVVLSLQLAVLALLTWVAVRLATRPLTQLAHAADALGPELKGSPLPEDGPLEVARAAVAFNAMQRRIAGHLAERIRILAAVSHDLQTPITRMRLRADLLDSPALRDKLHSDLNVMQALVQEGIAYARSARGVTENACRVDLHALLDSLVCDYVDAGDRVQLVGRIEQPIVTRPNALRRAVANLVDNALKFGECAEILVEANPRHHVSIAVRDRGPGIPPSELSAVLQPFYRVESSRNRHTGGTGLGLAIAQQFAFALGGSLTLSNRDGGGLEARLTLPTAPVRGSAITAEAQGPRPEELAQRASRRTSADAPQ
jgi:signal transduction histidine kinase